MRFKITPKVSCWHPMKGSAEYLHEEPFTVTLQRRAKWPPVVYIQIMWDRIANRPVVRYDTLSFDRGYCEAIRYPADWFIDLGVFEFKFRRK